MKERNYFATCLPVLRARLESWEREKANNQHGMQYLAERAIKLLKRDIEDYEAQSVPDRIKARK